MDPYIKDQFSLPSSNALIQKHNLFRALELTLFGFRSPRQRLRKLTWFY